MNYVTQKSQKSRKGLRDESEGHTDLTDSTDFLYSKDSGIQGLFLF